MQPELTAAAAEGKGPDPFAEARALHPGHKLVEFHDRRSSRRFVMAVPPTSPWYALLPDAQQAEIQAADGNERRG
jgi:hypothetical protein